MHHSVGQVQEKWLILILSKEFDAFIGIDPGKTGHIVRVVDFFVVLMKDHTAIVVSSLGSVVIIETLGVWHALYDCLAVRYVPFSNTAGSISRFLKELRHCYFAGRH